MKDHRSRGFKKNDRVQVRLGCGGANIVRDGEVNYVKRAFRSGSYTVILDKPLEGGRQTHCEPHEVFAPAQDGLFTRFSMGEAGPGSGS